MRLWLSKNSDISLREQLVTQITLAITSGDLPGGARLPSVRELARRFAVHPNTISAAYTELARRGWVERRKGSGVFVLDALHAGQATSASSENELDLLLHRFLCLIEKRGYTIDELRARFDSRPRYDSPDSFLLIEPDAELRCILAAEITPEVDLPVRLLEVDSHAVELNDFSVTDFFKHSSLISAPVALHNQAAFARQLLPANVPLILLHTRSIIESLQRETLPPPDAIITVASSCRELLAYARRVLIAVGIDADALDFRDARLEDWQRGLKQSHVVITDVLTARQIPVEIPTRVFRIINDEGLARLRDLANRFGKRN